MLIILSSTVSFCSGSEFVPLGHPEKGQEGHDPVVGHMTATEGQDHMKEEGQAHETDGGHTVENGGESQGQGQGVGHEGM